MNKITLYSFCIALLLVIGMLGKTYFDKNKLSNLNSELNKELMATNLEFGKAKTEFGNAGLYINRLVTALKDEIKERNAVITRYGTLEAKYNVLVNKKVKGTVTFEERIVKIPADLNLEKGRLYEATSKNTLVGIRNISAEHKDHRLSMSCKVRPKTNGHGSIPVNISYHLHLKLFAELVETLTPSGAVSNYLNLYELDHENKRVGKLEVTEFNVVVNDQRSPQFYWWAPHLDVGLFVGVNEDLKGIPGGSLGISLMGYGLTKNDLAWRFARLSFDLAGAPGFGLTPLQYNMGELLPLVSNIWIGPHVAYMLNRHWRLGLFLGAVL